MSQKFKSDIEVQAGLRDSSGSLGTSGQVLSTTGTNTSWINQTTVANDVQNTVKAGVAINKGQAVYVTGADGTNIIVGLASNTTEATSSKTLGLLNATVATNGFADVVQIGKLAGLNTTGATAGDPVWLGVNGNLIYGLANKPYAPAHLVFIGIVTRVNANNGEIFVNVQNGFELKEIHDVDIVTNVPINGDVLGYDGTLWVNKTIAEWLGYTPANASGTTNYVSKFTGATTLGNSQIFDNGTNVGIGDSNPGYKLTVIGNGYFNDNVLIGNGSQLRFTIPGINIKPELVSSTWSDLSFSTNNSEKMRITSGGNVGIGTSSPSYKLDVNGEARINNVLWFNPTSGYTAIGVSGTDFNIYNGSGAQTRLTLNASGNVGIGTISPSGKLDVNGTIKTGQKTVYNLTSPYPGSNFGNGKVYLRLLPTSNTLITTLKVTISGTWNWAPIFGSIEAYYSFYNSPGSLNFAFRNIIAATGLAADNLRLGNLEYENGYLSIPIYSSNSNDVSVTVECFTGGFDLSGLTFSSWISESLPAQNSVYVQTSLGIGTSSPGGKLHVVGEGIFDDGTNGRLTFGNASGQNDIYSTTTGFSGWKNLRLSSNNLILATNGTTEAMRITSSGNVGIGTTSPSSILHLNSAVPFLSIQGSTTGSLRGINIMQGTTVFSSLSAEASLGETRLSAGFSGWGGFQTFYTNGSEKMRITSDGRVGIGATSPTTSSILELKSNTKGFLPPRMSEGERSSIADPAEGLMVWDTDAKSLYIFDGSDWLRLAYA